MAQQVRSVSFFKSYRDVNGVIRKPQNCTGRQNVCYCDIDCTTMRKEYIWWLIELPYWFKAGFWLKFLGLIVMQHNDTESKLLTTEVDNRLNFTRLSLVAFPAALEGSSSMLSFRMRGSPGLPVTSFLGVS